MHPHPAIAFGLVILAAGLGNAQQLADGWVIIAAFQPMLFTAAVELDWAGIGGPGGSTGLGNDATPDDCADLDQALVGWGGAFFGVPSLGLKTLRQPEGALLPGSSTPAPPALVAACSAVRELLFGQEPGYAYASEPQGMGTGDTTAWATSYVLAYGNFDNALTAIPQTLEALVCDVDLSSFRGTESVGNEQFAALGFTNGRLLASVSACLDVAPDVVAFLDLAAEDPREPDQWSAGKINALAGPGGADVVLWDLDLFDYGVPTGLTVVCLKADVVDANNAVIGVFEDYGYFWVEGPDDLSANAQHWALPQNSDGRAKGQDCSEVGIPL